jgi:glutaredoxin
MSQGNIATSLLSTTLRGMAGINSDPAPNKPKKILQLYDIENCPYCRLAREALTELDLDAEIYPCPKSGDRYRPEVMRRGGKAQFPYLVDPNTGTALYESLDIVEYLYQTYGGGSLPPKWRLGKLQTLSSMLASAARPSWRRHNIPSRIPTRLIELYSFEASPYARPVRELLCQMELPYLLRNCGRNQTREWLPPAVRDRLNIEPSSTLPNRIAMEQKAGKSAIPYLYDPNTEQDLFDSDHIIAYLKQEYAV